MVQASDLRGAPLLHRSSSSSSSSSSQPFPSLDGQFQEIVQTHPDTLALVCSHQPPDLYSANANQPTKTRANTNSPQCLRWTYRDLSARVDCFATALQARGIGKGSLMMLFTANSAEYIIATWAAYRIGCVHVPLSPRCLGHKREAVHMVSTAVEAVDPQGVVVIAGEGLRERVGEVIGEWRGEEWVLIAVGGGANDWAGFDEVMRSTSDSMNTRDKDENQTVESSIFFTSGTTSLPKGCFVQASAFPSTAASTWRASLRHPMRPGDCVAVVLPNNHAFGYMVLMAAFLNGATVVFPSEGFQPEKLVETITRERCTFTALVPTMLHALSGVAIAPAQRLSSLKRIVLAGAPPTEEVLRICLGHLGAQAVENYYGMTEGIAVSTGAAESVDEVIRGRDVSIGLPLPGARVRICAKGSRAPVSMGAVGEVHFSGPTLVNGYIGNRDDDKFYTDENGQRWFCTGDKAVVGEDGRLYLVGRYNDTIIRGGENIEPSAIEAVLGQTAELHVLEPQIVRASDEVAGEVPVAVIRQDIDEGRARQLKDTVRAKMGALYVPAGVVAVSALGLSDYPRTLAGKVQKSKLTELVGAYWTERKSQARNRLYKPLKSHSNSKVIESLLSAIAFAKGEDINPATRLIDLGIDSITSIALLNQVRQETKVSLPSSLFFTPHTISKIIERLQSITNPADLLDFDTAAEEPPRECFLTLLQGTPKPGVPSLFMTPPGSGYAFSYEPLPKFANDLAVYALGSPFLMSKCDAAWTVEEAAAIYVKTIRKRQPEGPYLLGGWSMGAIIAYEEAYQLRQQGQSVLGIINLDMPLPRPDPCVLEPSVKLLEIVGFYPAIRRAGKPDMEIPSYRRQHSLASVRAKLKYSPRPMHTASTDRSPVRIFVIWAGHGDPDRLPSVLVEAERILQQYGPETQERTSQEWLQTPRESMGPGGWAEMVGEQNVECHVIDHAHHDTLMDPEVVSCVLIYVCWNCFLTLCAGGIYGEVDAGGNRQVVTIATMIMCNGVCSSSSRDHVQKYGNGCF
ncbi:acetyl-CoA synthetase-like protein [Aspergillus saccharolyticus JOP 1030-1]|uniref:Acetyl-CoA synthetase-like protein n=1 Tax=Aspergillus saccharolyticus JOP 1030-1 TaxID=1450539 RepID=A0A318Z9M1_9EURO|nr:acetyl-CoA synthetase-like protein [Aspergillus saccharolyticus JOP 1030-1]PYH43054.1 acetyl-CoA synthetase-like protein [Aspergillus saccharolyticus JOP 1030-1]